MPWKAVLLAVVATAAVAACGLGSSDADSPPSRGISSDIDATHQTSPSVLRGQRARDEPEDALPWQLEGRH
jgi:hypothetical protein